MKILVVDDEALARKRLQHLLNEIGEYNNVASANNGREAIILCENNDIDIILMDISMPGISGLEAAKHLSKLKHPPAIIFTTAFENHALQAFELHAVDYLLKPIKRERLIKSLQHAKCLNRAQLTAISDIKSPIPCRSHISVMIRGNLQLIPITEIYFFQAQQKYTYIRYQEGDALFEESIKSLESEFNHYFIRVHRNAIVSILFVRGITKFNDGRHCIVFNGIDEKIEISRRHLSTVRNSLKNHNIPAD